MGFLANFPAQVKLVFALKQISDFNIILSLQTCKASIVLERTIYSLFVPFLKLET